MTDQVLEALQWVVEILQENNVNYRIGGGLAANLYGSERPVNDIDISLSETDFSVIVPLVQEYIVAGPKHYQNEKWDCTTLSLNYKGQDIDMTDADTLMMSKKDGSGWVPNGVIYKKHSDVTFMVGDLSVQLMHPKVLVEYKQELSGDHQQHDIDFLKNYIKTQSL